MEAIRPYPKKNTRPFASARGERGLSVKNERRIWPFALTFQPIRLCPEKKEPPISPSCEGRMPNLVPRRIFQELGQSRARIWDV